MRIGTTAYYSILGLNEYLWMNEQLLIISINWLVLSLEEIIKRVNLIVWYFSYSITGIFPVE